MSKITTTIKISVDKKNIPDYLTTKEYINREIRTVLMEILETINNNNIFVGYVIGGVIEGTLYSISIEG